MTSTSVIFSIFPFENPSTGVFTMSKTKTAKNSVRTKVSVKVTKTAEPSLIFDKPGPQTHTREQADARIRDLRAKVSKMYADGKFKSSMAMTVPLTHIDNATYYKMCGCFDRAIDICDNCDSNL
jgi:hypothetical protein